MMPSIPLILLSLVLSSNHVLGLVTVPMPQIVLTLRAGSPNTNTHDLLSDTIAQSNAYFRDYFSAYYSSTKINLGFSHVSVSVKSNGVQPTSSSTLFQSAVLIKGFAYYSVAGETAGNVTALVQFALNDQNRLSFMNNFLRTANNPFLQSLTAMEVTIDGVLDGSSLPPLPSTTSPTTVATTPTTTSSAATSNAADAKKKAGISSTFIVLLVVGALVAFFVIRRRRQNRRYYSKQMAPPPASPAASHFSTRHYGSHPAFSFARRHQDLDSAVTYAHSAALGSPGAMRADRDEELAAHKGGRSATSKNRFHFDIDGEEVEDDERTEEWKVIS